MNKAGWSRSSEEKTMIMFRNQTAIVAGVRLHAFIVILGAFCCVEF